MTRAITGLHDDKSEINSLKLGTLNGHTSQLTREILCSTLSELAQISLWSFKSVSARSDTGAQIVIAPELVAKKTM